MEIIDSNISANETITNGTGTPKKVDGNCPEYGAGYAGLGACIKENDINEKNWYGEFYTSYEDTDNS